MAKNINITYKFDDAELTKLGDAIVTETIAAPEISQVFGVVQTGITHGTRIGFLNTNIGLMMKGALGCNPSASTYSPMTTSEKTWTPAPAAFYNEECYTDIKNTLVALGQKAGIDVYNMENSEYYTIFKEHLPKNIAKEWFRIAFFDDTAMLNVSGGGTLKNGVSVDYFKHIDGIFKQIAAIYGANALRRTPLTANASASYILQESDLTDANALDLFISTYRGAHLNLKSAPDKVYFATRGVFERAQFALLAKGQDTVMQKYIDGIEVPSINGIPVVVMDAWDDIIRTYFDNGTKHVNPHRLLLTTKSNLGLGLKEESALSAFDVFWSRERLVNITRGEESMDAKVLRDDLIQIAI